MRSSDSDSIKKLQMLFVVAIASVCLLTQSADASLTTIYQDNFDGLGSIDLGGTTPDISLGGAAWVTANSRGDAGAAQIFSADGTIVKDGPNSSHDAGALLPFAIEANRTYKLEATFNNNNSSWVAVGFASSDNTLDLSLIHI